MRFVNELGNEIELDVTVTSEGVLIRIAGPTSEVTNQLTRLEAQRLSDELRRILSAPVATHERGPQRDTRREQR